MRALPLLPAEMMAFDYRRIDLRQAFFINIRRKREQKLTIRDAISRDFSAHRERFEYYVLPMTY